MNDRKRGVEQSAPLEEDLLLPQSRRRVGASSGFTIRIYTVVVDAGDNGITATEIFKKLRYLPGFDGDTYQWWLGKQEKERKKEQKKLQSTRTTIAVSTSEEMKPKKLQSTRTTIAVFNLEEQGQKRIEERLHSMISTGVLIGGLDGRGRGPDQIYLKGRPPQGYRNKHILNPEKPWGYHDIDPIADREASRRHFATIQFLDEARKELDRGGRPTKARQLLEEAVRLLEAESR